MTTHIVEDVSPEPNFSNARQEVLWRYFMMYGRKDVLGWAEYVLDHLEEIQKDIATFSAK